MRAERRAIIPMIKRCGMPRRIIDYDASLTSLPETIGKLMRLRELYVSENQLSYFPESFINLGGLEGLYCWGILFMSKLRNYCED